MLRLERTSMPVTKVVDIAYARLAAPDLDLAEEFLTHFGLVRGPRPRSICAAATRHIIYTSPSLASRASSASPIKRRMRTS
jgi:hypothetical protein